MSRNFPLIDRIPDKAISLWRVVLAALIVTITLANEPSQAQNLALVPENVAGIWRGQEANALVGTMAVEVIFFPNGTYSRAHRLGSFMSRDVGTYTIVRNWIHFELHDYNPKFYKGKVLSRPMSDTWVVGRFDGHFMQATVGGTSLVSVQKIQ